MICVARLNGKKFYINPDLIEFIEETPDTVVTTTTGKKVIVEEGADEIFKKILEYKHKVFFGLPKKIDSESGEEMP